MSSTDLELIERILAGHGDDFRLLVERYAPGAITLAQRVLGDRGEAEEAVQDAFVRLHKALPGFRHGSEFSTWFYRIVYNVCLTRRARRRNPATVSIDTVVLDGRLVAPGTNTGSPRPDLRFEEEELRDVIDRAIMGLPEVFRGVFTLFFVQEMSYEEIAEVTGLPLNTVKTRLFRARKIMRDEVGAYLRGPELLEDDNQTGAKR